MNWQSKLITWIFVSLYVDKKHTQKKEPLKYQWNFRDAIWKLCNGIKAVKWRKIVRVALFCKLDRNTFFPQINILYATKEFWEVFWTQRSHASLVWNYCIHLEIDRRAICVTSVWLSIHMCVRVY